MLNVSRRENMLPMNFLLSTVTLFTICLSSLVIGTPVIKLLPTHTISRQTSPPPLLIDVTQRNARASYNVILELSLPLPNQTISTIQLLTSDRHIVTDANFSSPQLSNTTTEGNADISVWIATEFLFFGRVGKEDFQVEATTTHQHLVYTASFSVLVRGAEVLVTGKLVSGGWRKGVDVGSWKRWVEGLGVGFRIRAVGIGDLKPALVGNFGLIENEGCNGRDVVQIRKGTESAFLVDEEGELVNVKFGERCGLGISEDGEWFLIRFLPYRVGNWGVSVRLSWNGGWVDMKLAFDRRDVPPVVVLGVSEVLDFYGNEELRIGVANSVSPPREMDIGISGFKIKMKKGGVVKEVSITGMKEVEGGREGERELRGLTPAWDGEDGEVELQVLYQGAGSREVGSTQPSTVVRGGGGDVENPNLRDENLDTAVVDAGADVSLKLASGTLAKMDFCNHDIGIFKNEFVLVKLEIAFYKKSSFSEHKKGQIEAFVREQLPWLPDDGVRLVDVTIGKIDFAVLVPKAVTQEEFVADVGSLRDAVSDEDMSFAIGLAAGALRKNVSIVKKPLCKVYPGLEFHQASAGDITGVRKRLLPLWITLAIFGFAIIGLAFVFVIFKNRRKNKQAFGDKGDEELYDNYDPDVESQGTGSRTLSTSGGQGPEYVFQMPVGGFGEEADQISVDLCQARSRPLRVRLSRVESSTDDGVGIFDGLTNQLYGLLQACIPGCGRRDGMSANPEVYAEIVYDPDSSMGRIRSKGWRRFLPDSSSSPVQESSNTNNNGTEQVFPVYDPSSSQSSAIRKAHSSHHSPQTPNTSTDYHIHALTTATPPMSPHYLSEKQHCDSLGSRSIDQALETYLMKAALDITSHSANKPQSELLIGFVRDVLRDKKNLTPVFSSSSVKSVDEAVVEYVQASLKEACDESNITSSSDTGMCEEKVANEILALLRETSAREIGNRRIAPVRAYTPQVSQTYMPSAINVEFEREALASNGRDSESPRRPKSPRSPRSPRGYGGKRLRGLWQEGNEEFGEASGGWAKVGKRSVKFANEQNGEFGAEDVPWHNVSPRRPRSENIGQKDGDANGKEEVVRRESYVNGGEKLASVKVAGSSSSVTFATANSQDGFTGQQESSAILYNDTSGLAAVVTNAVMVRTHQEGTKKGENSNASECNSGLVSPSSGTPNSTGTFNESEKELFTPTATQPFLPAPRSPTNTDPASEHGYSTTSTIEEVI